MVAGFMVILLVLHVAQVAGQQVHVAAAAAAATSAARRVAATAAYSRDGTIPRAEVAQHQTRASMWVVVDNLWVVNVTSFIPHHPGQDGILKATLNANFSFAYGPEAHFAVTAAAFSAASKAFDAQVRATSASTTYCGSLWPVGVRVCELRCVSIDRQSVCVSRWNF
jgi:cytochrome b involved in lipid metabolism